MYIYTVYLLATHKNNKERDIGMKLSLKGSLFCLDLDVLAVISYRNLLLGEVQTDSHLKIFKTFFFSIHV